MIGGRLAGSALALAVTLSLAGCGRLWEHEPPAPVEEVAAAPEPQPEPEPAPRPAGRRAERPDPGWVASARERMDGAVESSCGPYRLVTDADDRRLLELCERIGAELDAVYVARFGIRPVGEARGAILLFARRDDFRRFAVEVAGLRAGYAGFSRAARGVVALPAEEALFATTLAHELTHLVNRRALGPDLAPWLAEGLSDAVGDAVGESGLEQPRGVRGVEGQARRLAAALSGPKPPTLRRLARTGRDRFDRSIPSYDYELSALAVRMLLADAELGPGFRSYLSSLAAGEAESPDALTRALGVGWDELDRRLASWLGRQLSPG